uniref:Putative ovule protein n=1 Tax=Solanum chacoense TaxID=4108 RepID=A0A0V0GZ05_SOLCH
MFKSQRDKTLGDFLLMVEMACILMVLIPLHRSSESSCGSIIHEKLNSNDSNCGKECPRASMTSFVHNTVTSRSKFHFPSRGYDNGKESYSSPWVVK